MPSIADIRGGGASRKVGVSPRARGSDEVRLLVLDNGRRVRIHAEQVARHGLSVGKTITPGLVAELTARNAYVRGRDLALRLLAIRSRSVAELRSRLSDRVPKDALRSVLQDLAAEGYLDDLAFARAWIASRMATRPFGVNRFRWELRQKGVPHAIVDQALRESVPEGTDTVATEQQLALDLARRRLPAYRRLPPDRRTRRLAALLQRRGFGSATIAKTLRAVGATGPMEDPDA